MDFSQIVKGRTDLLQVFGINLGVNLDGFAVAMPQQFRYFEGIVQAGLGQP